MKVLAGCVLSRICTASICRALISPSHYFRQIPFRSTSITFNFFSAQHPLQLHWGSITWVQVLYLGWYWSSNTWKVALARHNCCKAEFFCIDKQGILWTVGRRGKCGGSRKLTSWECETQAKYMRSEVSRVLILWFLWGFLLSTFLFILISSLLLCIGFSQKVCQLASRGFSEIWIST